MALAAAGLCGCVPNLGARPTPADPATLAATVSLAAPEAAWPHDEWWRGYGDPELDRLEAEALAGSPNLRAAEARVRRATAVVQQQGAALRPELAANARPEAVRLTRNQGFPDFIKQYLPSGIHGQGRLTLDLSFDLDLFGRNRAALAAATSEAEASAIDAAAARLYLSATVASAYADLIRLTHDRAAAIDALRVRRSTPGLIDQRFERGLANRVERDQQATTVPVAEADVVVLDRELLVVRHQIAALLGAGPDRGLAIAPGEGATLRPFGVPRALPLNLIGRRPDLVAARRRLEGAGHRIDAAHANFYPNVNLAAFAGVQSFGLTPEQALYASDRAIQSQSVMLATNSTYLWLAVLEIGAALLVWAAPRPKGPPAPTQAR